jgi:hypothetical protein
MSLVVAKIVGSNICIVSDTKLSPRYEDIRNGQHPKSGVIKTTILNKQQCVSFAGSTYFAKKALKEMEHGGTTEEMKEVLFRYHSYSEYKTAFIFCYYDEGPHILRFENGEIIESRTAWIGDIEAYKYYQQYYLGNSSGNTESFENVTNDEGITNSVEDLSIKNLKITINSKVPNVEFFNMAISMDNVLYYHSLPTVGGFRVQVTYDDGLFSYARYTSIHNREIDVIPDHPGRFGLCNPAKGSYNVNFANGNDNYTYAALHVLEANLGILYKRKKNGLMCPKLFCLDILDFSDFISQYKLEILVPDHYRTPKYYKHAEMLFKNEEYFEAIHWLCEAIRFSSSNQYALLYYMLGLSFHNCGRPLTASLCFEHAIDLDPTYEQTLANQKFTFLAE